VSSAHSEARSLRARVACRALIAVAGVVSAGALAGAAYAQGGSPAPSSSAVSQYAELVPTGKGPTAPGLNQAQASTLSPTARAALDGIPAATATALATIATSSDYGAPATTSGAEGVPAGQSPSAGGGTSLGRTVDAAASAASPISDTDLIGLLLTLLVITGGGAALAVQTRSAR